MTRGRPPKPPGQARTGRVELRLTPAERARLDELGGAAWIREQLLPSDMQPSTYSLPNFACIAKVRGRFDGWVVRDGYGGRLNHQGQWEDEPSPSNRSDEFIARTIWMTPRLAYAAWAVATSLVPAK